MCEPRFDIIEKTVLAMVKKEHGEYDKEKSYHGRYLYRRITHD